jgi:hypothetical protein
MNHGNNFESWNEAEGTFEGRAFPSEAEWLDLPAPPIADDFVARTLAALRVDADRDERGAPEGSTGEVGLATVGQGTVGLATVGLAEHGADGAADGAIVGHLLTPDILAAFKAPDPSKDFVARTLQAVQDDRRSRWRELLAKYVAPEPSSEFVVRTLRALANDAGPARRNSARATANNRWGVVRSSLSRPWFLSLVALAAAVTVVVILQPSNPAPLEQRVADSARASLASTYSATPLPAVLASLELSQDPDSLPSGGPDGMWLLLHREGR